MTDQEGDEARRPEVLHEKRSGALSHHVEDVKEGNTDVELSADQSSIFDETCRGSGEGRQLLVSELRC